MADQQQHRQQQYQQTQDNPQQHYQGGYQQSAQHHQSPSDLVKSFLPKNGPSTSQVLATITMVPLGGTLLFLAGLTLAGTILGLAVSTPLFIIFSPILVPATLAIGLSVAGILTSGAFGITALSSFSWLAHYLSRSRVPEQLGQKVADTTGFLGQKVADTPSQLGHKVQEIRSSLGQKGLDTTGQVAQKTKEAGQNIQSKAQESHESDRTQDTGRTQEGGKTRTREVKT